ncbi:MAG TPA: hypothetical protein VMC85_10755 [Desulfomonilaceae bacterium]|nr:hypothetical protein [Desulfomonilaceae bacterium]
MEFWIGLSVGMHLGSVITKHLERFIEARGLLSSGTRKIIDRIEKIESETCETLDDVVK